MKRHLAAALIGATLISAPVLAQSNPPANAPASAGHWITQEKAGQWRGSKLKGLNVYNNNNEKIGDIDDLIVDRNGRVEAVVIGVGGFLGMGEHNVAVPFGDLKWIDQPRNTATTTNAPANTTGTTATAARNDTNRAYPDHAVLNMTKDQLKAAPEFKYAR